MRQNAPQSSCQCGRDKGSDTRSWLLARLSQSAIWQRTRTLRSPFVSAWRRVVAKVATRWAYQRWIKRYDTITPELRALMAGEIAEWPSRPLISVIMPSYNVDPKWMNQAVDSVRSQIYPHWELCVSDDASTVAGIRPLLERYAAQDSRIRIMFRGENGHISVNSNSALDLASGDYVALLDADDCLSEDALYWVGREIALHPEVDLLFSDEDKIDGTERRFDPYFKSAWNPALMLSQNAFCHLGIFRRSLVERVGRFRIGYEGAQDHDLVLRCAVATTEDRIRHIPRVLYHWRAVAGSTAADTSAKSYAWKAGQATIADHLRQAGIAAEVKPALGVFYQVEYEPPKPSPIVSVLSPTTLSNAVTAKCLESILERSSYENFELLILANEEHLRAARNHAVFSRLLIHPRVRIIDHECAPFNYSRVNNLGVGAARGSHLCFLNDDVEVITEDWLERLVARTLIPGVGAAAPMLYYPTNTIQHAGVVLGVGGVAEHAFRARPRGYWGYFGRAALEQDCSCSTAACMLVTREVFQAAGGFDETLPVAFNDVDLCIRIRRTGARIVWTPSVEMYHHESLSFGRHDSPERREQFQRDIEVMRNRWQGVLEADPCYNPNLNLGLTSMFSLAWPPRTPELKRLVASHLRIGISRTAELPSALN